MKKTLLITLLVGVGLAVGYAVLDNRKVLPSWFPAWHGADGIDISASPGEVRRSEANPPTQDTRLGERAVVSASSMYESTRLTNQEFMDMQVQGDLVYDALLLQSYGGEICNYFTTVEQADSQAQPNSLAVVERFRNTYCGAGVDASVAPTIDPENALRRAEERGSRSATAIIEAGKLIGSDEFSTAAVEGILMETLDSAESPAMLLAAAQVLLSLPPSELSDPRLEVPKITNHEEAQYTRLFGFQIAACRKFSVCDRANVYSIRSCIPNSCVNGGSLYDYIESQLTPVQYAAALEFASHFD